MASRSPGNKNNLIYIKFRHFNNGLLPSSGKSMFCVAAIFVNKIQSKIKSKNFWKEKLSQTTYYMRNLMNTLVFETTFKTFYASVN
jgi:hypothetical protein